MERDNIRDIAFAGQACTVAKALASLMTEALISRETDQARHLLKQVRHMISRAGAPAAVLKDPRGCSARCMPGIPGTLCPKGPRLTAKIATRRPPAPAGTGRKPHTTFMQLTERTRK